MGAKQDLLRVYDQMKILVDGFQNRVRDIRSDTDLTETGKENAIRELIRSKESQIDALHSEAREIVGNALVSIRAAWKAGSVGRLKDGAYQAGLSNALKMVEVRAVDIMSFPELIEVYQDDVNALAAFRNIISSSYPEDMRREYMKLIPGDTRRNTEQTLEQIRSDIDAYISRNALQAHNIGMAFAISRKYMYDILNDDLTV